MIEYVAYLTCYLNSTETSQRVKALEGELAAISANVGAQIMSKDELIKQLQDQANS